MEMVNIKINGMPLSVPAGSTILEAARYAGINIPTLCWMKDLNEIGACRICVVEVVRAKTLVTACVYRGHGDLHQFPQSHEGQKDDPGADALHP